MDGWVWYDILPCKPTPSDLDLAKADSSHLFLHLQGTISDPAFCSTFDMLKTATDVISPAKPQSDEGAKGDVGYFLVFKIIHERGCHVGSLGVLPKWVRPILRKFHPWYRTGGSAAANLVKLVATVVSQSLETLTN